MKTVLALDIGGTNIRAAIIDENLKIINVIRKSTVTGSINPFLEQICQIIDELGIDKYHVSAIAAGVPGRVRWDGFIAALPNIHIDNIPLKEFLENRYKIPTFVRNDAEVAAIAEGLVGAGKNSRSSYFVTISTGIGGALIVDKKLKQASYEIGHTLFPYHGNYYEIEKIACGTGIVNILNMNGIPITQSYIFFEKVKNNDPQIIPIYHEWLDLLADFFKYIQDAFQPNTIVLSGGVMKSGEVFLGDLRAKTPQIQYEKAQFDQDAGLIGAACYGFSMIR